ncbi:MAG: putative phosphohydrolase [Verrucomicrobiales bacterium]|nr:putative phosphohydrolase [Verrucomicrobiales bacterium]
MSLVFSKNGSTPGPDSPGVWRAAVSGASGTLDFSGIPKGYYYAAYLAGGGSLEISARLPFSVGTLISTLSLPAATLPQGKPFSVQFSEGRGTPKDWVGLFKAGQTPGVDVLTAYLYVGGRTQGSVTFDLPDLPPGEYFVTLFINDSYTEVSPRAAFTLTGDEPLKVSDAAVNGRELRLRWRSTPGRTYVIQKNNGLAAEWLDVRTVMPADTFHEEILTVDATAEPRVFFRLMRP